VTSHAKNCWLPPPDSTAHQRINCCCTFLFHRDWPSSEHFLSVAPATLDSGLAARAHEHSPSPLLPYGKTVHSLAWPRCPVFGPTKLSSGQSEQEPSGCGASCDHSARRRDLKLRLICPQTLFASQHRLPAVKRTNIRSRIINLKGLLEIFQGKSRRHAAPFAPTACSC